MNSSNPSKGDILIIDDNQENLEVLMSMLTERGYHVRTTINGQSGIAAAQEKTPDLILLEVRMPGMDGYQVCGHLKADESIRDVPIIFLSILDRIQDRIKGFEAGGVDYISKPFHPEEVLVRVETHLSLRAMQKQLEERNIRLEQEIVERKQIEEALRESEAKWEAISENSPAHVMLLDRDANILFINRTVPDLSREEVIGTSVYDYTPSDFHEVASNSLAHVWLTGEPTSYITEYVTKAGEIRYFDVWVGPVFQSGKVVALVSSSMDITERKKAEENIEKETNMRKILLDNLPCVALILKKGSREIVASNKLAREVGAVPGTTCYGTCAQRGDPCPFCRAPEVWEDDQVRQIEVEDRGVYYAGIWVPLTEDLYVHYIFDITKRKRAEEELRRQQEEQEIILDSVPAMIFYKDKEDRFIRVNEGLAKAMNMPKEEIIGKTAAEISPTEEKDYYEDDKAVMASGEPKRNIIEPLETLEGTRWVQTDKIPYRDAEGNIIGVIGFAVDITERKQAEEALRESEEKLNLIADSLPVLISYVDADMRYQYVNAAYEERFGVPQDKILGRHVREVLGEAAYQSSLPGIKAAMSGQMVTYEIEFPHSQEGIRTSQTTLTPHVGADGEVKGLYVLSTDITERKRLEEELLKVQKLESVGVLAGGIAHDLNNLLTGVLGNISLARLYEDPVKKDMRLAEAEKASMLIQELTQQLLTFSKGGAPILETAAIAELLRHSSTFILSGSNARCEFSIPDDLWPVEVDKGRMNQVINNLVINAKQAMPSGGIVRVSAENISIDAESGLPLESGKYIKVSVEDKGIGIPEEHVQKIFDPFFTTKQAGSGLGLATSYSIMEKHNGYITVESEIGVGTTFHLYLPASQKEALVADAEEEEDRTPIMGEGEILVIDDQELVRELVSDMLDNIGYKATTAIDGAEAMELYKAAMKSDTPFAAVIIDLTIPGGMGGKEIIQRLMEIDPEVKAIVSSGYSSNPIMANFMEYGFKGAIAKPYKTKELSEVLYNVVVEDS